MAKLKKCAHCGKMFKPSKKTQNYCSLECAEAAIAKQKQWNDVLTPVANVIELEYLTFSKAATLMGCSRQYVYKLVAEGKLQASRLSNRMSFIRKSDIEKMLQANPYHRVLPEIKKKKEKKAIIGSKTIADNTSIEDTKLILSIDTNQYIAIEEAMEKYEVSNTTIYNKVKTCSVPQCRIASKTYYDRKQLDEAMSHYMESCDLSGSSANSQSITPTIVAGEDIEWITIKDCTILYHKSLAAIKSFASRYEIPARWIDGKRYYSKTHLDMQYNPVKDEEEYYTISQLYSIYGISKVTATSFCQKHGIRYKTVKRRNYFFKEDVDKVMAIAPVK